MNIVYIWLIIPHSTTRLAIIALILPTFPGHLSDAHSCLVKVE